VEVENDKTQASYDHGILTIGLPKAEHLRPKTIKVSIKK
jgi:HSP20 family molecular chaperone IbpA